MTNPNQSIQELREQLMNRAGLLRVIDHIVIDRLEAAEVRIAETRAELVKYFDDIDVDYEGEPNDLDTMVRQAAGQLHEARSWSGKEAERANVAEARIAELEAAQVPRDMVSAPRDGTMMNLAVRVRWRDDVRDDGSGAWVDDDDIEWGLSGISGWLPLPDQSKEES